MTFEEKIKEKLRKIREDRDYGDYKTRKEEVLLEWVLALLPDYVIIPKRGDLHGEKALEEVIEWMHGKTVVDKQKLREFEELLKTRPETIDYPYARKPWCNPERSAECFELLEKKFQELTK